MQAARSAFGLCRAGLGRLHRSAPASPSGPGWRFTGTVQEVSIQGGIEDTTFPVAFGIDAPAAAVRYAVYRGFADTGAAPSPGEVAEQVGLGVPEVHAALRRLADVHVLVLNQAGDAVRMAHPFSAAPMGYVVTAAGVSTATGFPGDRVWWGGCAWDSFGISAALGERVTVTTQCPHCEVVLRHTSSPEDPPALAAVVHVPWPAYYWWDDVVATCTRIRTFCSAAHVRRWLAGRDDGGRGGREGTIVALERMWLLGHRWYADRLDPQWRPRSREAAQEILAGVGMTETFWDLP